LNRDSSGRKLAIQNEVNRNKGKQMKSATPIKRHDSIESYLRQTKYSETLLINQLSLMRSQNNDEVFKFGFGQSPFPVPEHICQALADNAHRKEYMSVQGHLPLRQEIVNFHQKTENKQWQAENIIVGAGSKILLFCLMAAFKKAEILLTAPSWVSYEPQAKLAGHKVRWLDTDFSGKWRLTADQLETYCLARADKDIPLLLILNYPSNPTGQTYDHVELQYLAKVMKKYQVIVIADEIYSLLTYENNGEIPATLDSFYPEGCIVSSGLSKWCGAGGWRLGFLHIPSQLSGLLASVIGVASETYSCAPSPIQMAATEAYQNVDLANDFLSKQTKLLNQISDYCANKLSEIDIKVHKAQGGFYLFPDFSAYREQLKSLHILTSEQLTKVLLDQTGVALLPGSAFGLAEHSLTARLAFVDFDDEQLRGTEITAFQFLKIRQGIERLNQWFLSITMTNPEKHTNNRLA